MVSFYRTVATCALASAIAAAAAPASAAVVVNDRITTDGTKDIFFSFNGGAFSVQVDSGTPNGLTDPEIFLFRDNGSSSGALTGNLLANDDDSGPGLSALISGPLAAGNYVLSIGTFNFTQAEARSGMADFDRGERSFVATFSDGVRVNGGAVPEPATWGLLLVGFGMVGGALRYRRKHVGVSFA